MVVFDITNADSFTKAKNWVKELQRQGNPNMIMALAGNKADLAGQRAVTTEDAKVIFVAAFVSRRKTEAMTLRQAFTA